MRKEYDFKPAHQNPYIKQLKKQVTIRLNQETISYFKEMATKEGMPYQMLINLYLNDCANAKKKINIKWAA